MLYCAAMVDHQDASARLIKMLGGTSLGRILAVILDAAGPMVPLGAQALYTLEPMLSGGGYDWSGLGETLEDPQALERFIHNLRVGEGEET